MIWVRDFCGMDHNLVTFSWNCHVGNSTLQCEDSCHKDDIVNYTWHWMTNTLTTGTKRTPRCWQTRNSDLFNRKGKNYLVPRETSMSLHWQGSWWKVNSVETKPWYDLRTTGEIRATNVARNTVNWQKGKSFFTQCFLTKRLERPSAQVQCDNVRKFLFGSIMFLNIE